MPVVFDLFLFYLADLDWHKPHAPLITLVEIIKLYTIKVDQSQQLF